MRNYIYDACYKRLQLCLSLIICKRSGRMAFAPMIDATQYFSVIALQFNTTSRRARPAQGRRRASRAGRRARQGLRRCHVGTTITMLQLSAKRPNGAFNPRDEWSAAVWMLLSYFLLRKHTYTHGDTPTCQHIYIHTCLHPCLYVYL